MKKQLLWVGLGLLGAACQTKTEPAAADGPLAGATATAVSVRETYLTPRDTADNVDSPTFWVTPTGEPWVIVTAKETDRLLVYNATTGKLLRKYGTTGTALGQLDRPNGVSVVDDLLFVVERDNHRVQVFQLPDLKPLAVFGAELLQKPYGLALHKTAENSYRLWVTDNYETPDEQIPPVGELGRRVRVWDVRRTGDKLSATPAGAFGATTGPGVLYVVESIYADPIHNQLLVSEELEDSTCVKVYDLQGRFTGQVLGQGLFKGQAEGIALYPCGEKSGYWVLTDQSYKANIFHVYERGSLVHLGSFKGETTLNTDGVWVTPQAFEGFAKGAFFAVHDDGNLAVFDWALLAERVGLKQTCP